MNTILTPYKRNKAFALLGEFLLNPDQEFTDLIQSMQYHNAWFTPTETFKAVYAAGKMLRKESLDKWFSQWDQNLSAKSSKRIGLILAGNIPMVGFHDIISVLASGHSALIKLSSTDQKLIPYLFKKLVEFESGFTKQFTFVDRLVDFDAIIATGSNNTSRYFEHYFGKVPHIIRKNRNSIAVLAGDETEMQLRDLGKDIFDYYGLGCRNVSKLFVPEGYDFRRFFESIEEFNDIANHHKYCNNYDYNKSIFLVNGEKHLDNGFLLLKPDERFASPLACLFYEEYKIEGLLGIKINETAGQLQCVVTGKSLPILPQQVDFGKSQQPELWDYADGINTMDFLVKDM